jgi:hypothetical protein
MKVKLERVIISRHLELARVQDQDVVPSSFVPVRTVATYVHVYRLLGTIYAIWIEQLSHILGERHGSLTRREPFMPSG